jgi:hypothetical protein
MVANETLTLSVRSQFNGREWVGYKQLQTTATPGGKTKHAEASIMLFYFIFNNVNNVNSVINDNNGGVMVLFPNYVRDVVSLCLSAFSFD